MFNLSSQCTVDGCCMSKSSFHRCFLQRLLGYDEWWEYMVFWSFSGWCLVRRVTFLSCSLFPLELCNTCSHWCVSITSLHTCKTCYASPAGPLAISNKRRGKSGDDMQRFIHTTHVNIHLHKHAWRQTDKYSRHNKIFLVHK